MEHLNCIYTRWKSVVQLQGLDVFHVYVGLGSSASSHDYIALFCGNADYLLRTTVSGNSETIWLSDFPSSIECIDQDDAIAAVIESSSSFKISQPLTSLGIPAFVNLDFPEQASDLMKSWQVSCSPEEVEILDIGIMNDLVGSTGVCYLAGGEYRCRTAATEGSALNFLIVDRDDILGYFGYFGMNRSKLQNLTSITGTFSVGEVITGGTSGCKAKVLSVGSDYLVITFWRWDSNDRPSTFTDSETITGQTSGATAVLGTPAFTEGDVLVIKPYVKDEWVEGLDVREVRPGGSKQLPQGLYFRVVVYNSSTTEDLRVKVSLILATS